MDERAGEIEVLKYIKKSNYLFLGYECRAFFDLQIIFSLLLLCNNSNANIRVNAYAYRMALHTREVFFPFDILVVFFFVTALLAYMHITHIQDSDVR